jgi:hypothetical protein
MRDRTPRRAAFSALVAPAQTSPALALQGAAVLAFVAACLFLALPLGAASDPFYDRLFFSGTSALANGDAAGAARKLRISCFGLLEGPPARLATCLGHLALAQSAAGDSLEATRTIERLLEVERQFQGVSRAFAPGPSEVSLVGQRNALEALIKKTSSSQALSDLAAFRWLAVSMLEPDERMRELNRRIAVEPRQPEWRLALAELFAEKGQFGEVVRETQHLLDLRPSETRLIDRALCLRAVARAAQGDCSSETLSALAACRDDLESAGGARHLSCLIDRADAAAARLVFEQMSDGARASQEVQRLEKELRKLEKRQGN